MAELDTSSNQGESIKQPRDTIKVQNDWKNNEGSSDESYHSYDEEAVATNEDSRLNSTPWAIEESDETLTLCLNQTRLLGMWLEATPLIDSKTPDTVEFMPASLLGVTR